MGNNASLNKKSVPKWFWLITIIALLWYLMDMSAFIMRVFMLDQMLQSLSDEQKTLYSTMPSWVNMVFAAEVFGGVLGCLALLFRKKWALPLFYISIAGVLSQTYYVFFLSNAINIMGKPAIVMPVVAIVIGIMMVLLTRYTAHKEWLV